MANIDTSTTEDNSGGDTASPDDGLFRRLKREFVKDKQHSADWRKDAEEDYAFVAGEQWSEEDKRALKDKLRPIIVFNRIDPLIRAVSGEQINNAQEVRYIPREMGDVQTNELLTSAADWFRDQCDAGDEESDGFWDAAVCGLGCTDSRLDMEEDPDEPKPVIERVDPLEMVWDRAARKRNYSDAKRVWRVREMSRADAKELFPDASESDLDARWARLDDDDAKVADREEAREYRSDQDDKDKDDESVVTIVQCQYWEKETYYKVALPPELAEMVGGVGNMPGLSIENGVAKLSGELYGRLAPKLEQLTGQPLQSVKLKRRVYRQCFLGRIVLKRGDAPCPDHFSFNFITGFRDRNKGTFYGIVRGMKDPQRWANKWLSQILHILNSTAKGGVMAEKDAVEDQRQFEESWAKQDAVTWTESGAIANARIKEKPGSQLPAGFFELMNFAISSVRDVSGINLEMLGMREADQPASLEFQRRQAGITILAILFGSLRRYRRSQGAVMLYYIQNYLPDNMLVRVIGDGAFAPAPGEQPIEKGKEGFVTLQAVRAAKSASIKYDIIVDEGPTSPNQKERVWQLIGPNFWNLPPPIQMVLIDYSPFPSSIVEKVKAAGAGMAKDKNAEFAEKMQQLEGMLVEAKVMLTQAQAKSEEADAAKTMSEIGQQPQGDGGQGRAMVDMQKMQVDAQIKAAKIQADAAASRDKTQATVALGREKIAMDRQNNLDWMQTESADRRAGMLTDAMTRVEVADRKPAPTPKPAARS